MRRSIPISILSLLTALSLSAQTNDLIIKTQGITSPLHQANTGKIVFTSRGIPATILKSEDFLHTYQLTNKSNLFITVFLDNSITNYLHRLAPDLSADSLARIGNYQFTLLVDGKLTYQSNLLPGAPYKAMQDTATIISKPLIDNEHEGAWWSQSLWNRFMLNGGDSALTEGSHLLKMEIRPYVRISTGIKTGQLIASGELSLNVYRKPPIDISAITLLKVKPAEGLRVSHEKFDSAKIKLLKGKIDAGIYKNINGIVVLSHGKLLIEEYFKDDTRNTLHDPRSVGKSFASSVTGIAIAEGYLRNEDQSLKEFYDLHSFSNYSAEKENVTIKDLLTMSAVFDGDDNNPNSPGNEENMYPKDNWVKFALDLPVDLKRPKGEWHYFTAGVVLLGDILQQKVPGGLERYAEEKLFRPLHISRYQWQYTPQHVPNTAGGIQLRAIDFAKYGLLYKNGGKWNGKQLIPAAWVEKSFSRQRAIPGRADEYYGYLFWNKTYTVNGKAYETYYCTGNGGNKIFVFKDQPWVIVITASAYNTAYAHRQVDEMMREYILPAIAAHGREDASLR